MISALTGTVTEINEGNLSINVNGVEFTLAVSNMSASYYGQYLNNGTVKVYTVFVVRQEGMYLYGFKDKLERECFNQLTTVPGVGGRAALKILSSISVQDFIHALDARDISTLAKIPGVGNKTAQKLILQLRDTLVYTDESASGVETASIPTSRKFEDVVESFVEMGFDKKTVLRALDKTLEKEKEKIRSMGQQEAENYIFPILLRSLS